MDTNRPVSSWPVAVFLFTVFFTISVLMAAFTKDPKFKVGQTVRLSATGDLGVILKTDCLWLSCDYLVRFGLQAQRFDEFELSTPEVK